MKARYCLFKNPPRGGSDPESNRLHARLVKQQPVGIDLIVKEISLVSSFSPGDIKGLLASFQEQLAMHLSRGETVELEGLGYFSVAVKNAPATEAKEVTPSRVMFGRVAFRCSGELRRRLRGMKFERAERENGMQNLTDSERKENILNYIYIHRAISTSICRGLNHCTGYRALKDLKELQAEGKIVSTGPARIAQYTLATREKE
ncbi:MAG: HU family DNA-binding protein [Tannerellaceae bacterium]|jgi:predicted histone-like DNA-binding protein|nr:HU family DNA-binding protein [Tannerellaceae bacterium]